MRDHKTKLIVHVNVVMNSLSVHEHQDTESLFEEQIRVCLLHILSQALLQQELLLCSSLALTHFAVLLCKTVVINNAIFSPTALDRQRNLYLFYCQIFFNSAWPHFQDHLSLTETTLCLWF